MDWTAVPLPLWPSKRSWPHRRTGGAGAGGVTDSNVYFYMSGKRLYWDFYLTPYAWDWLGDEVYATMPQAQLNGRAINPPYGPHREVVTYDFHSSILTYQHIGGGAGTIKRGDRLWMFWEFIGSIPGHGAWRAISCKIP